MASKLSATDIEIKLKSLNDWSINNGTAIEKEFSFANFNEAIQFINNCAVYAQKINHHPEWSNIYNKVTVILTTHDCAGLSQLDFDLASFMDDAAKT